MKIGSLYNSVPSYNNRSPNKFGLKPSSPSGNYSDRDSNISARSKRSRVRKSSNGSIKSMKPVTKKSKSMDFTDYAYREAVNRLKYLLAESYTAPPQKSSLFGKHLHDDSADDMDNLSITSKTQDRPALSEISKYLSPSYRGARSTTTSSSLKKLKPFSPLTKENLPTTTTTNYSTGTTDFLSSPQIPQQNGIQPAAAPPEILSFIEKQEDYIEQLEKESKFCRDELSNLLGKVKDVISENEALTEHARSDLVNFEDKFLSPSSESDENYDHHARKKEKYSKHHNHSHSHHNLSGPNIVFESRISELEAELMQSNIELRKVRSENDELKRKTAHHNIDEGTADTYRKQIENLQRDKIQLEDNIRRLEHTIDDMKAESRICASKRTRDIADMALFEKNQLEMEIKHLRDELERQHDRVRELQHEMARRLADERSNAERRYNYQVDQLGGDLNSQWEQVSKLQMELERQKRIETDLKRELSQKNTQIDELKMELKGKRSSFLSDLAQVNAEKQSLEQEITSLRLQLEKADRQSKIEAARLNAEINSLRQRLDRADGDILQTKRENLRLHDDVANLEKELTLGELKSEIIPTSRRGGHGIGGGGGGGGIDIAKTIADMQEKHGPRLMGHVRGSDFGNKFVHILPTNTATTKHKLMQATAQQRLTQCQAQTQAQIHAQTAQNKQAQNANTMTYNKINNIYRTTTRAPPAGINASTTATTPTRTTTTDNNIINAPTCTGLFTCMQQPYVHNNNCMECNNSTAYNNNRKCSITPTTPTTASTTTVIASQPLLNIKSTAHNHNNCSNNYYHNNHNFINAAVDRSKRQKLSQAENNLRTCTNNNVMMATPPQHPPPVKFDINVKFVPSKPKIKKNENQLN